jgi:hypothetical protein
MNKIQQTVIAKKWWRSLSLNEQKALLIKHDPYFNKMESHKITSPYNNKLYPGHDLIFKIWQGEDSPIPETIIKFSDGGAYIIRPDGIGDMVIGPEAQKAMTAINKKFGYTTIVPMAEKVKFIEDYKTQNA